MTTVDIATMDIAEQTHKMANALFFRDLLSALQTEAARCGYQFGPGSALPTIPDELRVLLARAVLRARRIFFQPLRGHETWEWYLDEEEDTDYGGGYGAAWVDSLLIPLAAQGWCLSPGADASSRLTAAFAEQQAARASRRKVADENSKTFSKSFDDLLCDAKNGDLKTEGVAES
jgi:hypothetical protein